MFVYYSNFIKTKKNRLLEANYFNFEILFISSNKHQTNSNIHGMLQVKVISQKKVFVLIFIDHYTHHTLLLIAQHVVGSPCCLVTQHVVGAPVATRVLHLVLVLGEHVQQSVAVVAHVHRQEAQLHELFLVQFLKGARVVQDPRVL